MGVCACIRKSWFSVWRAIVQMPLVCLAISEINIVIMLLPVFFGTASSTGKSVSVNELVEHVLSAFMRIGVGSFLVIKVHRFVLCGERELPLLPLGGKPLMRVVLLLSGIGASMVVIVATISWAMTGSPYRIPGLVWWTLCGVALCLAIRLCLVFPAIALGSSLALHVAWKDSRGHFWSIAISIVLAWLPQLLLRPAAIALVAVVARAMDPFAVTIERYSGVAPFTIGALVAMALLETASTMLLAATVSWLYVRYSTELPLLISPSEQITNEASSLDGSSVQPHASSEASI